MLFEIPLKLKRNDNRPEVSLLKYDIPKTIVCEKKKSKFFNISNCSSWNIWGMYRVHKILDKNLSK